MFHGNTSMLRMVSCWRMLFSDNRIPLVRSMRYRPMVDLILS